MVGTGQQWADFEASGDHRSGGSPSGVEPTVPGFTVRHRVGSGAHGVVWAATRDRDGAEFAVKVVPLPDEAAVCSAVRELAILRRVNGKHVVALHEAVPLVGAAPALALVMTLMAGGSMRAVVASRLRLSPGEVVTVLAPVAGALAGLHRAGVVHGDLAPDNVLFDLAGRPHVADFGVARVLGETSEDVFATEGFAAPELLRGRPPTPTTDVYAVGALGWYALTGEVPGPGPLRPPRDRLVGLAPDPLVEALDRALSVRPQDRPTAAELSVALFDAVEAEPIRLVVGAAALTGLTRRIRDLAPPAEGEQSRARWWRRSTSGLHAALRSRGRRPEVRRRVPGPTARSVGAAAAGAVVCVGIVVGLQRQDLFLESAPAKSTDTPRPAAAAAALAVDRDPAAPERAPAELVQHLMDARARALMGSSRPGLAAVDVADGPAHEADTRVLEELAAAGSHYAELGFRVRSARPLPESGAGAQPRRVRIRARVDTTAYVVEDRDGVRRRVPGQAGPPLVVQLELTTEGWRIRAVLSR